MYRKCKLFLAVCFPVACEQEGTPDSDPAEESDGASSGGDPESGSSSTTDANGAAECTTLIGASASDEGYEAAVAACAAWGDAFCEGLMEAECEGAAESIPGTDAAIRCGWFERWSVPVGDAMMCEAASQGHACLPALYEGDGSPFGGPWVRSSASVTEVRSRSGIEVPIGFAPCETLDPIPQLCACAEME